MIRIRLTLTHTTVKKFDYVYFAIYHYNSRQSYFHDSLSVRLKSMYLLSFSVGGWILCLQTLFLRLVKNAWFTSQQGAMIFSLSMYTCVTAFFYWLLIMQGVDQKIFNKYESKWNNNTNQKRDLAIAFSIAAIPYLILVLIKVFFPRP